jgi:hypothetical protein
MEMKAVKIAVTPAMVAAAEGAYIDAPAGNCPNSLAWFFHNRMQSALEAALAEVNHARSPELDASMLKTLTVVAAHFEAENQPGIAQMMHLIHHRIASDSAEKVTPL